jgi:UDP-2,3-diacylglucosamine hydrolase
VRAWLNYLQRAPAQRADALFILGDLFEVWIGDDVLDDPDSFASECAAALKVHSRDTPTYFLCGNRDFLLGETALAACGMQRLSDPTVLEFQQRRWLLSHGDELCLADRDYLQFRAQVRSPDWQNAFLSKPLAQRESVARDLRLRSEARKRSLAHDPELWADVDAGAARSWLASARADTLIHGHTHRPANHDLGAGLHRVVLSDWDASARPPRLQVLRLNAAGLERRPQPA